MGSEPYILHPSARAVLPLRTRSIGPGCLSRYSRTTVKRPCTSGATSTAWIWPPGHVTTRDSTAIWPRPKWARGCTAPPHPRVGADPAGQRASRLDYGDPGADTVAVVAAVELDQQASVRRAVAAPDRHGAARVAHDQLGQGFVVEEAPHHGPPGPGVGHVAEPVGGVGHALAAVTPA